MKTILKVIYVVFIAVMAFIIYLGMSNTFTAQNYYALIEQASVNAKTNGYYDDLPRCFSVYSTPIDKQVVASSEQNGENVTRVYSSVNQFETKYYDGSGNEVNTIRIENVYLFIIYNPTFQYSDSSSGVNSSAFRFYGETASGDEVYYDYNFTLSKDVNADKFIFKPTNEKEGALYSERHLLNDFKDYNFIFFPLTQTHFEFIKQEKQMTKITGYNIIDNTGSKVYKDDGINSFDFNQEFFNDMSQWVSYMNYYNTYKDDQSVPASDLDPAIIYISQFTENPNQYVTDFDLKYMRGYAYEDINKAPEDVLKSIGVAALFVLVAAILYMVFFHLNLIRNFVKRFSKKATPERYVPNKMPEKQTVISKNGVVEEEILDSKTLEESEALKENNEASLNEENNNKEETKDIEE